MAGLVASLVHNCSESLVFEDSGTGRPTSDRLQGVLSPTQHIPFDPKSRIPIPLPHLQPIRTKLTHRLLQQDLLRLVRDLRRRRSRSRQGRPTRPPRRNHRPQRRLLPTQRQTRGGDRRRRHPLERADFSWCKSRFRRALTCEARGTKTMRPTIVPDASRMSGQERQVRKEVALPSQTKKPQVAGLAGSQLLIRVDRRFQRPIHAPPRAWPSVRRAR